MSDSRLSVAVFLHEDTSFQSGTGATSRVEYSSDFRLKINDKWAVGIGHRSNILNVDGLQLQTNGYLHTFFFPLQMSRHVGDRRFRLSIAPALSGSSNVTKDPDEYSRDAFQLLAALVWETPIRDRLRLSYGVCGDHRLGGYKVYPIVSLDWQPRPDWRVQLGFPASMLTYEATDSLDLTLRLYPNGGEWYVKSRDLASASDLVYEAYVLESALSWQPRQEIRITASLAMEFDGQYEATLSGGNRTRLSSDSAGRIGVALAWYF